MGQLSSYDPLKAASITGNNDVARATARTASYWQIKCTNIKIMARRVIASGAAGKNIDITPLPHILADR